jgi:hypothetical protein
MSTYIIVAVIAFLIGATVEDRLILKDMRKHGLTILCGKFYTVKLVKPILEKSDLQGSQEEHF